MDSVYRDVATGKYWTYEEIENWIRIQNMLFQLRQKDVESEAELEQWDYFRYL